MAQARPTKCPTCGKMGNWFDHPFGPFCSRRCKLVDLGKWLDEENVIPGPLPENLEDFSKANPAEPD